MGVKEPIVTSQGAKGDRILVQLPGIEDPERAKEIIQTSAVLEWKAVTYPPGVADFGNCICGFAVVVCHCMAA